MSNLKDATSAIHAELTQAKAGAAYYQSRVEALEQALKQLGSIDGAGGAAASPKSIAKSAASNPAKAAKGPKAKTAKSAQSGGNQLPFTGGTYWTDLITSEPQSAPDILKAALSQLSFKPSKDQVKKLAGRQTFALNTLVATKKIKDSGKGRERRFFKD
ncbi:MAG TPA: hypothetical protein VIE65_03510 [Methylobacter sp.]|jgi:hypothetical protein